MSLRTYCPRCSEAILYNLTKPIACPFCMTKLDGSSISTASLVRTQPTAPVARREPEPEYEDTSVIDNISQLDVEIESSDNGGIKLGEIGVQKKTGFSRPKLKRINKKSELETFRSEAGFGKTKSIDIGDNAPD